MFSVMSGPQGSTHILVEKHADRGGALPMMVLQVLYIETVFAALPDLLVATWGAETEAGSDDWNLQHLVEAIPCGGGLAEAWRKTLKILDDWQADVKDCV